MLAKLREKRRILRHDRVRFKVIGTKEQPRLCIHRSLKNLHIQVVDDVAGKVLFGLSTLDKGFRAKSKKGSNVKAAALLGETFASKAKEKGITNVCFDRGGYLYHGRIKAFADAARKGGLVF